MNGFNNDTARTRDNIREGIIRYRKDTGQRPLKYSSLFQYIQNFSKLQNLIEPESELNILFIRKKDKIDFVLENYSLTTKRNYYNCIIVIMESHGEYFKEDKDLLNYYIIKRDELNEIYNKEIDKMLNQIKKEIQGKELWKMDKILITNYDYQLIQFYIALSLQIEIPSLRNDIAFMKLYKLKDIKDSEIIQHNHIIISTKSLSLVFRDEDKVITTNNIKLINLYKKYAELIGYGEYILQNKNGTPLSRNGISHLYTRFTQRYLHKNISTNILRKILSGEKDMITQI